MNWGWAGGRTLRSIAPPLAGLKSPTGLNRLPASLQGPENKMAGVTASVVIVSVPPDVRRVPSGTEE